MMPDQAGPEAIELPARLPLPARLALLSTNIVIFLGLFSLGPALPQTRAAFIADPNVDLAVQLIGGAAGFAFALTSMLIGDAVQRLGYRRTLIAALILFAFAGAGGIAVTNLWFLVASRIVVGVACALIVNASLFAVGVLLPEAGRAKLIGTITVIGGIFAVLVFPVIGQLASIDWRLPFLVHLAALPIALMAARLPLAPPPVEVGADAPVATGGSLGALLIVVTILVGMMVYVISVFGALYLSDAGVRDAMLLSLPSTAAAAGSILGSSIYVMLATRLGISAIFAGALVVTAAGLALAGLSGEVILFTIGVGIASTGTGMYSPNLNAAAIAASPQAPGRMLGLANGLLYGSMILFPFAAGPMTKLVGGIGGVILCFAGIALAAALAYLLRARTGVVRAELLPQSV